jgi:hypothetical protein
MNTHNYNFPNTAQLDQAASAMRDLSPVLAAFYKGLVANGLEREDAAAVVVTYIMHNPSEAEESQ